MSKRKHSKILLFSDKVFLIFLVIGVLSALCAFLGRTINPINTTLFVIPALGSIFILLFNLVVLLYWLIRFKLHALVSACTIIVFIPYITAMWQPGFGNSERSTIGEQRLRVLSLNTAGFRLATTPEASWIQLKGLFREENPDVICLQEVIKYRDWDIAKMIKEAGYEYFYSPDSTHTAVLSKYPIIDSNKIVFEETANSAIWVDVAVHGRRIRVYNAHMQTMGVSPYRGHIDMGGSDITNILFLVNNNTRMRATQTLWLRDEINRYEGLKILCGDMNETPYSYVFKTISKGFKDGFKGAGSGWASTFWGGKGLWRLDYILHDPNMKCIYYQALNIRCSDHKPVLAEYTY